MNYVKRAIVLAAGKGSRLYPITETMHKSLVSVGGKTIFDRMVTNLLACGITEIVMVVGFKAEMLREYAKEHYRQYDITFLENDRYESTNNILSLWLARRYFNEDFLLVEADVCCDPDLIEALCSPKHSCNLAALALYENHFDGTVVEVSEEGRILRFVDPSNNVEGAGEVVFFKTINIYRLSAHYALGVMSQALDAAVEKNQLQGYYETIFRDHVATGEVMFGAVDCSEFRWFEIDNLNDLLLANDIFISEKERIELIRSSHGGHWRRSLIDHCLLYNHYYPPQGLLDHLSKHFTSVIRNYPAGQKEICKILGHSMAVDPDYLAVANGSSEFIKVIGENLEGTMVVPTPSFNEYLNAAPPDLVENYPLSHEDGFVLDMEDFAEFTRRKQADVAVVLNPNNPTSRGVAFEDIKTYLKSVRDLATMVVVDESFIEFSNQASVIPLLQGNPNLVVIKSFGKSHGIGGVRIGFIATANKEYIDFFRSKIPIWNVNGLAEQYLRIFSSFNHEFRISCEKIRNDSIEFYQALREIDGIEAYPPEGNFVLCRILVPGIDSSRLAELLLSRSAILIKDCRGKHMEESERYFRVAVRLPDENKHFLVCLGRVMESLSAENGYLLQHEC